MAMRVTVMRHLVGRATKTHRSHRIVMAAVIAIALLAAPVFLSPISSGAVLPAPPHEIVTMAPAVLDDLVIQSTGYLEFDWSAAEGGLPGFGLLPDASN